MKRILISLLFVLFSVSFAFADTPVHVYQSMPPVRTGVVTIINPVMHKVVKKRIPSVLYKKTSLEGKLTINEAMSLLTRATGIPVVIVHSSFINNNKNNYYYIHKPLYIILNAVIKGNGYIYKYKNGKIKVYGEIAETFNLPIFNIDNAFSATTGVSNNNNMQSGQNGVAGNTQTQAGATTQAAPASSTQTMQTGVANNPGGQITSSMTLTKTAVHYITQMLKPLVSKTAVFGVNAMQGIVYVKDKPSNVFAVAKWVKKIKENLAEAVWLKVQILDVTLNNSTQVGINWNAVFNSAFKANPAGLSAITIGANLATGVGIASGAPSIELANSAGTNSAILEALKTQGKVDVLSEPTLIVPNGETGVINSSSISSYIQTVETISTGISSSQTYPVITQVSAGLSTAFTPHINKKKGMITVVINFLDNNITGYNDFTVSGTNFSEPIIQSKTLADIIRVRNNHTVIMGGIITTNKNKQNYGVPLLSDIPLIGALFSGVNNTFEKDDLIMMITPKIIKY